jgi:adenylylsulfate kinase
MVIWLTGLSGSGKTTIARGVAESLRARGLAVVLLDGDDLRAGLSPNLGFSRSDRDEHVRRVGFIADLLSRSGVVAIVAVISPFRATREAVRARTRVFIEVFVSCSLDELMRRDTKGLYARAHRGELSGLTGVNDPYEEPLAAELRVDTERTGPQECVTAVIRKLEELGSLRAQPQ